MKKKIMCSFLLIVMTVSMIVGIVPVKAAAQGIQMQTISAGHKHMAVIKTDGSLWTWGENRSGQLGDGTTEAKSTMVKIMDDVAAVSVGDSFTAAIKTDGSLWTWGDNYCGQLGDGTKKSRHIPQKIMNNVAAISAGNAYMTAIKTDGSLWTWGNNVYGQLGNGTIDPGQIKGQTPTKVMDNVASVSAAGNHTAAIKTDGSLWIWGWNDFGKLGYNNPSYVSEIRNAPEKLMDNVALVSLGAHHSAAIKKDGSLWIWGSNRSGQLGDGTTDEVGAKGHTPTKIMDNAAFVSAGHYQTFAVKTDGSLWTWGDNGKGNLGDGTTTESLTPKKVMDNVTLINNNYYYTVAQKADGSVWAWGWNPEIKITSFTPIKILENIASGKLASNRTISPIIQDNIRVLLNNNQISFGQPIIVKNNQVMVPLRTIFESMGATVQWNGIDQSIKVVKGDINVSMQVDSCIMYRNGQQINIAVPPQRVNDVIYIPAQAAAVSLRADFNWDEGTGTIYVSNGGGGNAALGSSKYSLVQYEEKMKTYAFDILYNNRSAESSEAVTKAEALKLAIAATLNISDISGYSGQNNEYPNASWVDFARYEGITKEDINITNYNEKAKYIDVISYFENCKAKYLKEYPIKAAEVKLKDLAAYSAEQQAAVKDMAASGIIDLSSDNLKGNDYIHKGQLNELAVNFAEKYSTILMKGDKRTFDPSKMPSNAKQYPYILADVDKNIYELPFAKVYPPYFLTPGELFINKKGNYPQVKTYTEEMLNGILNIDYRTITEESLRNKIASYFISISGAEGSSSQKYTKSIRDQYIKYVKDNEIIIEGKAKLQVPIIYFDGFSYRARLKLNFEIKHSKTKDNLLYLDLVKEAKKTYERNSYELFVDYPLTNAMGSNYMFLEDTEIYEAIINKDKCGINKAAEN